MRAKGFAAVAAVMFVGVAFAGAGKVREMKRVALGDTYAVFSVETEGAAPNARCGVSYWMEGFEDDTKTAWCDSPVSAGAEGKIVSVRGLVGEFDYQMAPVIGVGDGEDCEIVANGRTVSVTTAAEKGGAAVSIDAASLKALPVEVTFAVLVESLGDADSAELKLEYGVKGANFNESVALGKFEELPGKYILQRLRGLASGKEYEMRVKMSGGCSAVSKVVGFTVPEEACQTAWVEYPDGGKSVTYIRSTGEQMIDTGIVPGPDTSLELRFARPKTDAEGIRFIFGQDFAMSRYALYHVNGRLSFNGMGDQLNTSVLRAGSNYVCRITCTAGSENGTVAVGYAGGELKGDLVPLTTDVQMPLVLFMTPSGELASVYDLQALRIEKDGACVRDFRPALDGKDVPCLYDLVSKTYFYNTCKGAPFQAGPRSVAPTSESFVTASVVAFDGTTLVADVTRRKGGRASALYACFGPDYCGAETNGWAKCVRLGEPFALMAETVAATVSGIAPADAYLRFWSEFDGWSPTLALTGLKATPDPKPILSVRDIAVRDAGTVDVELDLRAFGTGATAADICAEFAASTDPATDKTVKKTAKVGVRTARDLYVQDGLLACWDGEEGLSKDAWRDLVAGAEFAIKKGVYDSTNSCLVYNRQGADGLKGGAQWVFPYGAKTVELVATIDNGVALMTPEWAGCVIGEWGRKVLLHNRTRSNGLPYVGGNACTYSISYAANNALLATSYMNGKVVEQLKCNEWYDVQGCPNALIGGRANNDANLNGRIYALRVYNRVLDAAEIAVNAEVDRRRFRQLSREKLIGEREVVTEAKLPQVAFGAGKTEIRPLVSGVTVTGPQRFTITGLKPDTNYAIRFFATNGAEGGRVETEPEGFVTEKEAYGALVSSANAATFSEFEDADRTATENNILRGIVGVKTSGNICNGDIARLTDGVARRDRGDVWVGDGDTEITWKFGRQADIAAVKLYAHWSDVRSVIDVTAVEFRGADGQWRAVPNSNFGGGRHGWRTLAVFAPRDKREVLAWDADAMRIKFNNSDAHGGCKGWRAYREIEAVESVVTSGILKLENSVFDAGTFTGEIVREATATNACDAVFACYGMVYGGATTSGWANVRRLPQGFAGGETTLKAKVEGLPADIKYLRFFADHQGWTDSFYR